MSLTQLSSLIVNVTSPHPARQQFTTK